MRRQWGAAAYTKCNVPLGSLGVQPVDGTFPTGAPTALLSPMPYLMFGGTGSGTLLSEYVESSTADPQETRRNCCTSHHSYKDASCMQLA